MVLPCATTTRQLSQYVYTLLFLPQYHTQEEIQSHLSSKLLTSVSSPFVQASRLLLRRAEFHYPTPSIFHFSPREISTTNRPLRNPLFAFIDTPWRTRHGEHNLSPLRRNPNTRPVSSQQPEQQRKPAGTALL